ncbi:type I-E CRISPR-associated protein Cse2/CasB [Actinomadura adrarensis]|uniref:Type I-E CRISPR-associated protein Cse2/CasB n=1 Tax=Actinomadura adrarensis TaxID=1819600 RepID=A0ABW3CT84_9ACTN
MIEQDRRELSPYERPYLEARSFVDHVHALCEDPGKRAALRSGLGRPLDRCHRMHQVIAAMVPDKRDNYQRAYYAIASMIASLPPQARGTSEEGGPAEKRDFGVCLAEGVGRTMRESAAEARLNLLTRQSVEGVHRHLPAAVRVLADRPSAVDWAQLLLDLRDWDYSRDRTTRRWLQSFYRTRLKAEREAAERADAADNTTDTPQT